MLRRNVTHGNDLRYTRHEKLPILGQQDLILRDRLPMTDTSVKELRKNFKHFDANNDGKIELDEFAALMNTLSEGESIEEISMGFSAIDTDGSGVIDFEEFAAWFSDR